MVQLRAAPRLLAAICVFGFLYPQTPIARAIVVDVVDDFQDGTSQNWGFNFGGSLPVGNAPDAGPSGIGDHSLYMSTTMHGGGKLIVINSQRWSGNWTAAGVARVALDVRNPTESQFAMRLGVVGPGGVSVGSGDGHITDPIPVPADNQWHSIVFNVLESDLTAIGATSTSAALASVKELRIYSNPLPQIIGQVGGSFYLDNIRALGPAPVAGDYNADGIVNAADYTIWRDTLGQTGTGLAADGTGADGSPDGVVDVLDYAFWKSHFNDSNGGGHHALGAVATVPEPFSLFSLALGMFAMLPARRRKELAN